MRDDYVRTAFAALLALSAVPGDAARTSRRAASLRRVPLASTTGRSGPRWRARCRSRSRGSSSAPPTSRPRRAPSSAASTRCRPSPLSWRSEDRRLGPRPPGSARSPGWPGLLRGDLVLWHHSIDYVGAGLATVLGNMQVVLVGLLAWVLLRRAAVEPLAPLDSARVRRRRADLGRARGAAPTARTPALGVASASSPALRTPASCWRCARARATGAPGRAALRRDACRRAWRLIIGLAIGDFDPFPAGRRRAGWSCSR